MNDRPMEVVVTSKRFELPETVRRSAARKTDRLSRYLGGMARAEVCFSKSPVGHLGDPVTCEIVLEGHKHVVRAVGVGGRPADALDAALDKAGLQLTRLKRKLVGRSRPRHGNGKPSGAAPGEAREGPPGRDDLEGTLEGITEL